MVEKKRLPRPTAEIKRKFVSLVNTMNPDVLSWGGALSEFQIQERRQSLLQQWTDLELRLGRTVSTEEAKKWSAQIESRNAPPN